MLTQAPLVMPPSAFSPVRIGNIYQRFGSLQSGLCQNIIKASVPFLLEEGMCTYDTDHVAFDCIIVNIHVRSGCTIVPLVYVDSVVASGFGPTSNVGSV